MDDYIDRAVLGTEDRFAIGQPVPRSEDPVLLRGEGHYSDDFNLPGQAYAVIVRSPLAKLSAGSARRQRGPCPGFWRSIPRPIWRRAVSARCRRDR